MSKHRLTGEWFKTDSNVVFVCHNGDVCHTDPERDRIGNVRRNVAVGFDIWEGNE